MQSLVFFFEKYGFVIYPAVVLCAYFLDKYIQKETKNFKKESEIQRDKQ